MEAPSRSYVPALGFDWLTPFYDLLLRLSIRERALKGRLIDQARIHPNHAVLDVGCGTGTLAIMIKRACPQARVVGLDGDARILEIARRKIQKARLDIELVQGMAFALSLPPSSFDRVLSTLVFHHLTNEEKQQTLVQIRSLLRPGGELHIAAFGKPHNALMKLLSLPLRLHGHGDADRMDLHLTRRLSALIEAAGFTSVRETGQAMTPFGTLTLLSAAKPDREALRQ